MWTDIVIDRHEDNWFERRAVWQLRLALWPHRSYTSGRWIWLARAYKGTVRYSDGVVMETRWLTPEEWLWAQLQGQ